MAQVVVPEVQNMNIASLYVGDLKSDVTEQTLWNAFSPYGQVLSVRVCRNSQTQASLGYGYVNYRTQAEAEKAMKAVNFTQIEGRSCRVMWSMRDPSKRKCGIGNLFIKNIDPVLDTRSLYEAFSSFGPVMSCKIAVDEYGVSKGYGFIQFYSERDAEEARKKSDGVPFMKKKIVVTKFVPKSARVDAKPINPADFTNLFVKNFRKDFTIDDLKNLFSKYGEITSCVLQVDEASRQPLGYGFVNFATPESAYQAVKEMDGLEMEGCEEKLCVCKAMKKIERTAFLKKKFEDRKREFHKQHINLNLYIKNFDETVDDEKLRKMFEPYGQITSCHVMVDESGKSRGFGFVCFSSAEEARHAIDEMNSKVIDTKPLYVAYAQSKEERKKMLELRAYENNFRPPLFAPATVPIMYPQPGPMPYPPQYARFPPNMRQQTRGMAPGNQGGPMQGFVPQQNVRGGYPYHGNVGQGHYRPRGNSNAHPQQGGGNVRPMNNYNQRVHHNQQPVQATSNAVTSDVNVRPAKEMTKSTKAPLQDTRSIVSDRIFHVCKATFNERGFDMKHLTRIAGAVIDCFTDSQESVDPAEITEAVLQAYKTYCTQEVSQN